MPKIKLINFIFILVIIFTLFDFIEDIINSFEYCGIDLRNRIVGARVIKHHLDPYFFKWSEKYSKLLLDPRDIPELPVTRLTIPPSLLLLHLPFSDFYYKNIRIIWTLLQWFFLLFSIYAFTKAKNKKIIWITGLLLIADSYIMRLHIERGQIYIFYVFLISLAYYIYRKKSDNFISGLLLGFTASIRFPYMLIIIPFIFAKKLRIFIGFLVGLVSSFLLSLLIFGKNLWISYFRAMRLNEDIYLGKFKINLITFFPKDNIEGYKNLWKWKILPIHDTSIQYFLKEYFSIRLHSNILILIFFIFFLILCVLMFLYRNKFVRNRDFLFFLGMGFVILSEYFIPAARYSYYNVIYLIPLLLIVKNYGNKNIANIELKELFKFEE